MRCNLWTDNFQKQGHAWCLDCRAKEMAKGIGNLYCTMCGKAVWETYTPQNLCGQCAFAVKVGKTNAMKETKETMATANAVKNAIVKQKSGMQKGEVKKLPAVNSPLWTDQWAVQGSGTAPYIVSHKKDGEWQCSCPAWTRNTPREDCKHILKVKLVEKVPSGAVVTSVKTVISVDSGVTGVMALNTFEKKGRKFR